MAKKPYIKVLKEALHQPVNDAPAARKFNVYIFSPVFTGAFNPVLKHEDCTDVEIHGSVLHFTDQEGNFHRTTLLWEVIIAKPTGASHE